MEMCCIYIIKFDVDYINLLHLRFAYTIGTKIKKAYKKIIEIKSANKAIIKISTERLFKTIIYSDLADKIVPPNPMQKNIIYP